MTGRERPASITRFDWWVGCWRLDRLGAFIVSQPRHEQTLLGGPKADSGQSQPQDRFRPVADFGLVSDTMLMDRNLEPGTKVRLTNHADGSWEDGVVVHCWLSDEINAHDCYVAFFGEAIPAGQPAAKPYVLRYASTSLTVLEE